MLDILFHNIQIPEGKGRYDIGVRNGIIDYLEHSGSEPPQARERIAGEGKVLIPGLVETHIHLDKAFLSNKSQIEAASLSEAIAVSKQLKYGYTKDDIRRRATQVLNRSAAFGVTAMRCQVEVDPILGLDAMEVTLELKEQWRDTINLQIVAFPQEGIFQQPGTAELLVESLRMGADIVGGIPYNDTSAIEHLKFVFDLAEKYGKPVDFHVDFSDNPNELHVLDIARETIFRGYQGRVSVGHVTSLGSVPYKEAVRICERLAEADLQVICLPATDLYLGGRQDEEAQRRGLTPVKLLQQSGVNVVFGTNNIRNAFTPFGTGDPLDIAMLLAHTVQLGTRQELQLVLEMATTRAARALQLDSYGIGLGAVADLVLMEAESIEDIVLDRPSRLGVWKHGVKKAETTMHTKRYEQVIDNRNY
jgi:cytosine deaminase